MLERFYNNLFDLVKKEGFDGDRLSDFFIDEVGKRNYDVRIKSLLENPMSLIKFSIESTQNRTEISKLKRQGLVEESNSLDVVNTYNITFRGIVEYEKELFDDTYQHLVNSLNMRFEFNTEFVLKDEEKVLAYFLLALGRINESNVFKINSPLIEEVSYQQLKMISKFLFDIGINERDAMDQDNRKTRNTREFFKTTKDLPKTDLYKAGKATDSSFYLKLTNEQRIKKFWDYFLKDSSLNVIQDLYRKLQVHANLLYTEYNVGNLGLERPDIETIIKALRRRLP